MHGVFIIVIKEEKIHYYHKVNSSPINFLNPKESHRLIRLRLIRSLALRNLREKRLCAVFIFWMDYTHQRNIYRYNIKKLLNIFSLAIRKLLDTETKFKTLPPFAQILFSNNVVPA